MKLSFNPRKGESEYNASQRFISQWLQKYQQTRQILRIGHDYAVGGQLRFLNFLDCAIISRDSSTIYIDLFNFHHSFTHMHAPNCPQHEDNIVYAQSQRKDKEIRLFMESVANVYVMHDIQFKWSYTISYDCDYVHHKVPACNPLLHTRIKKQYNYTEFVQEILNGTLEGFLVVSNLSLKKGSRYDNGGFCIFKYTDLSIDKLSKYTLNQMKENTNIGKSIVVGGHQFPDFCVVYTSYFNFLASTFGFEEGYIIHHGLMYQHNNILKNHTNSYLQERQKLKKEISVQQDVNKRKVLEKKADIIKLLLNSLYGYNLLDRNSSAYTQYRSFQKKNLSRIRNSKNQRYESICYNIPGCKKAIFLRHKKPNHFDFVNPSLGSAILFHSKCMFLDHMYLILRYANPSKLMISYCDTDCLHICMSSVGGIENNIDSKYLDEWKKKSKWHFDMERVCGQLVLENDAQSAIYLGEKIYHLCSSSPVTKFKGLPKRMITHIPNLIDVTSKTVTSYNRFEIHKTFGMVLSNFTKEMNLAVVPYKRYFVSPTYSTPLM